MSHPVWVCGLKHADQRVQEVSTLLSHPVWVCGLKPRKRPFKKWCHFVTPCMGVWIETLDARVDLVTAQSHTLYGCVD